MGIVNRVASVVLPMLVLGAVAAHTQGPPVGEMPKFFGRFATTVGGWSEYAVTETDGGKRSTMRSAVVGKEGEAFWYEVVITEGGARNIIKMFLKGEPNDPENIQRLIMKNGDQPAQEMPREFVVMGRRMATAMFESRSGAAVANLPAMKNVEVGPVQVTVKAGTFAATRNNIVDDTGKVLATYDFNPEVLPFGVVRSETEKVTMELTATGKDAVSLITEEPTMMKSPPAMPEGNPRGMPPGMTLPLGEPGPKAPATGGYGN